ncbi:MAG: 30S ribosomal protein S4e [bacterium]|nr:30S ribosomal protein S4e [bacterium]
MAKKGPKRHLKRLAAPVIFPVPRKTHVWVVRSQPGPHPLDRSVPLLLVVRDVLGYAKTAREARRIIAQGEILVDGRPRKDYKYPVGLFDVIEIPKTGEIYRVLFARNLKFRLVPIDEKEKNIKPAKIIDKTTVKGGHVQLNLTGGRNQLIRVSDPARAEEARQYRTQDTVLLKLVPRQEIAGVIPLEQGCSVYVMAGRLVGLVGKLKAIEYLGPGIKPQVVFEDVHGEERRTIIDYIIALGKEQPVIKIPEEIYELPGC